MKVLNLTTDQLNNATLYLRTPDVNANVHLGLTYSLTFLVDTAGEGELSDGVLLALEQIFQTLNENANPHFDFGFTVKYQVADNEPIAVITNDHAAGLQYFVSITPSGKLVKQTLDQMMSSDLLPKHFFSFRGQWERNLKRLIGFLETIKSQADGSLVVLDNVDIGLSDMTRRELVQTIEQFLGNLNCHVFLNTQSSVVLTDAYPQEVVILTSKGQRNVPLTLGAEPGELLECIFGAKHSAGSRAILQIEKTIEMVERENDSQILLELLNQVGTGFYRFKVVEALNGLEPSLLPKL